MKSAGTLRRCREERGLSQAALAEIIGVEAITIYRWEQGDSFPQRRFWPKLSAALDAPIGELIAIPGKEEVAA